VEPPRSPKFNSGRDNACVRILPGHGNPERDLGRAAIGAGIGAVRSLVAGDLVGIGLGVVVGAALIGLQGVLFPNPSVILQACGDPFVSSEEILPLLERADYPTLMRFNRHARKSGLLGPLIPLELGRMLDEKQRRG
jgi:hypothetical protein